MSKRSAILAVIVGAACWSLGPLGSARAAQPERLFADASGDAGSGFWQASDQETKQWGLCFPDFQCRERGIHPTRVDDEYDDNIGGVDYHRKLDLHEYTSEDVFREYTIGATLHWYGRKDLDVYLSLRLPFHSSVTHKEIEYENIPIASPTFEFRGQNFEMAAGARWDAYRVPEGPLRNFGVILQSEARAGWANSAGLRDDDVFAVTPGDKLSFRADWQELDLETRLYRFIPFPRFGRGEGGIELSAGVGASAFFYHENWRGDFNHGAEFEKMDFNYREDNPLYGCLGVRIVSPRVVIDLGGRVGGEQMVFASIGYKF